MLSGAILIKAEDEEIIKNQNLELKVEDVD